MDGVVDVGVLDSYVQRLVRLADEKAATSESEKEVYAEAKEAGLLPAQLRALVNERHDADKREKGESLRDFIASSHEALDAR